MVVKQERRLNIGLLEDSRTLIELMKSTLEVAGHSVHIHTDGPSLLQALAAAQTAGAPLPYDLVIVDLRLPGGLSGHEVLTRISHIIPPDALPIIVLSGASQHELEQVRKSFPHIHVLRKPFILAMLLQVTETVCQV